MKLVHEFGLPPFLLSPLSHELRGGPEWGSCAESYECGGIQQQVLTSIEIPIIFYPNSSVITKITITIMTNATITFNAIKPSVSKMSNIRKSVAKIQYTRHIRRAIAAMLITYDKHPLIIVCHLSDLLFRGLFKLLYEKLDKLVRQC